MGIEIGILNWIQNLHTPAADAVMCFVTRLGDGGILWILLIVLLFLHSKNPKKRDHSGRRIMCGSRLVHRCSGASVLPDTSL